MPAEIVRGKPLPDLAERLRAHVPKAALIWARLYLQCDGLRGRD
jgi:hypothetical protein